MQAGKFRSAVLIKALLLLIFIAAAVALVRFTGVREFLTVEKLGTLLAAAGIWGPLVFILIYAVGVCLFIPGTLLTALGAASWSLLGVRLRLGGGDAGRDGRLPHRALPGAGIRRHPHRRPAQEIR